MKRKTLATVKYGIMAIVIGLSVSQATVNAQQNRSLEGVWRVTITPRNCTTGVPNPTVAHKALFTFHKGGTMSAWAQNSVITATRSPSHGLWRRDHGWSEYSYKFVHLRYNLTTGAFQGKNEASGTLVLSENGDEFMTDGSAVVFDVNDNPATPGCSNSVGTRFTLEP